jgi:hypothetical protein
MAGNHREEDKKDSEVKLAWLEQSIATYIDKVGLVKKDREANSTKTEHEEDKAHQEEPTYNDCEVYFGLYQIQETH